MKEGLRRAAKGAKRIHREASNFSRVKAIALAGFQALNPGAPERTQMVDDRPSEEIEHPLRQEPRAEPKFEGEKTATVDGNPPQDVGNDEHIDLGGGASYTTKDGVPIITIRKEKKDENA